MTTLTFHLQAVLRAVFTGTNRTSDQEREPIENDEERRAMKRGGMPPTLPQRVANPRIRDDQVSHEFCSNSDKMHRATSDDALFDYGPTDAHKHDLIIADLSSRSQ